MVVIIGVLLQLKIKIARNSSKFCVWVLFVEFLIEWAQQWFRLQFSSFICSPPHQFLKVHITPKTFIRNRCELLSAIPENDRAPPFQELDLDLDEPEPGHIRIQVQPQQEAWSSSYRAQDALICRLILRSSWSHDTVTPTSQDSPTGSVQQWLWPGWGVRGVSGQMVSMGKQPRISQRIVHY